MTLPPFQRLVDAHWRDVARLAHALAGPGDADDVAQQAWAQALAAYPKLRSETNLRGWLMTVTARCAMDAHRGRARRAVPVAEIGGAARAPTGGDPADTLPDEQLWQRVARLPARQRTAIGLRYVADLDHAQVAAALGTTAAASRRLVSDALACLRTSGPEADPDEPDPDEPDPDQERNAR